MSYFKLEDYEKAKQQEQDLKARAAADLLVAADPAGGDKTAKVMTMSQALGVPAVVYDQNMDYFDAQFQKLQNERMLKRSPTLTNWLTSAPENMAVAADDLPSLSFWDTTALSAGVLVNQINRLAGGKGNPGAGAANLTGATEIITNLPNDVARGTINLGAGLAEGQASAFQAAQQDSSRTFAEILQDEAQSRTMGAPGQVSELERRAGLAGMEEALNNTDAPPGMFDVLNASLRWFASRTNDLAGVNNTAQAEGWRKWAGDLLQKAEQFPTTRRYKAGAEIVREASGKDLMGTMSAFANGFYKDPVGMLAFMVGTMAESSPQIAATVATTAAAGPLAGAGMAFGTSYLTESASAPLQFYNDTGIDIRTQEGRDRLLSDPDLVKRAHEVGVIRGMVVGVFDALSLGLASKTLAANPVIDRIAGVIAQGLMASAGEYSARTASGQKVDWAQVVAEGLVETLTAPAEIWAATREMSIEEARSKKAIANKTFFEELAQKSGESKLRQRLPAKFREFVDAATKNGPVSTLWVPADKFAGYWQTQGLDPELVAEQIPGVGVDAYRQAVASGSDIAIPTASYAAHMAGSQHDAFFIDNMRLSPEQMTFAEARDFEAAKADLLAQTMDQADRARLEAEMETRVEESILQRVQTALRGAGISKIEAETNAAVWPAFFTAMAERSNLTVEELADRIGLPRVEGETPQGMMGLEDQTRFTSMMREVRARAAQVAQVGGTPSAPSADLPAGLTTEDVASLVGPELSGGPAQDAIRAAQIDDIIRYLDELGANLDTMTDEQVRQMVQADAQPREGGAAAGRRLAQTVALRRGSETLAKLGIAPGGRYTTREIATALEARQRKKWGTIDASDRSPETSRKIASWMVDEVLFEVEYAQQNPEKSAVGWYSEKYQRALDSMAAAFPEFTSDAAFSDASLPGLQILKNPKNARDFFTVLMAITSDGARVADNFRFAAMAYSDFRRTGRVNSDVTFGGERNKSMRLNLENIQETLDKVGADEMASYLLQKDTVKNLKKIAQEQGRDFSTAYKANMELPYSALIFGPKLGAFYANLMGGTGYLTMDRWWSRTFNRYRGTLLQKPTAEGLARFKELVTADRRLNAPAGEMTDDEALALTADYVRSYKAKGYKNGTEIEKAANTLYKAAFEGLEDQPLNASDREFMINTTLAAQKMLARRGVNLTVADIQAVLWYYEKRLYGQLGARQSQDISYEEIARKVASVASSGGDLALGSTDEVAGGAGDQEGLNDPASGDLSAEPEVDVADETFSEAGSTFNQEALNGQGTAGNGAGRYAAGGLAPLPGAPNVEGASGPDPRLVSVAEQYARDYGLDLRRQAEFVEVDPERAARIADAYAQMPHAPQDPQVKTAYAELIRQTVAQYRALEAAGYRFWFFDENTDPYGGNPWNAMRDLRANQSMAVFATEAGFGSGATDLNVDDNPMLADTGIEWSYGSPDGPKKRVLANDLFRAVHDAFGHGIEGAGFRARGEENAWQAHVRLFYGPAVAAITTETRGQNSWLNYGPYGEKNRTAAVEDTVFADQKTGLMPEWTWTEGRAGDMAPVMNAGTPPELNANGMVELQHFSKETRATIDPAFAGTGPMRGTERRMAGPAKSYYGISTGKPGGYVRERMLGDVLHTVELDPARLYNWFEDPMRLKDGLDRSASSEQQVAQYEQLIKDAGFAGYWVNQGPNGASAAVFEALPVSRVESAKRPVPPQFLRKQPKTLFQSGDPTQTEAFKKWFGSSKVVDENGAPLVVYHGTQAKKLEAFDLSKAGNRDGGFYGSGVYLTPDEVVAEEYATSDNGEPGKVISAYVSIQNPFMWDASTEGARARTSEALARLGIKRLPEDINGSEVDALSNSDERRKFNAAARAAGYDGVLVFSKYDDGTKPREVVAFAPTQIKSVDNVGTFNPNDPRILNQDRTTFGPRGSIEFAAGGLGKGETVIRLFRSRDLSTFMHESGHFFLSALQLLAQDTQGAPQVAAMYDTVKGWWRNNAAAVARDAKSVTGTDVTAADVIAALDNGTSGDADKDIAIDVGMQEQWARAFEAYLMEGKSPSKDLRTVFERMRAWLLAVYRSVTNLNVEISDDIRSVFDRMLATDRQIAEASKQSGFEVMSAADAEKVGILPEDYAKLRELHADVLEEASARVLADTMRPIRQQQEAWYRDERAKVEAEVRDRLALDPVFRAIKALRFGKDANDEVIDPPIKLSREAIAQAYDKRFLTTLPGLTKNGGNHRFSVMANEGGMAPDVAAEMFDFASGQSLLEALESAPRFEDAVRAEVEKVMFERHGDPLRDGTVETAAMEEIHGDRKARYLEEELRLLTRPAGKGPKATLAAEVKFVARQTLSRMQVKDARRASRFLTAERKAGADALKAIASGNRDAAVEAKRRQLLNHHLYAEASKVDAEIEKIQAKVKRQFKGSDEKLAKTKDINYVKAARAVAAKFGLVAPDTDFDFNMWLEQLKFEDPISADAIYQAIDAYSQDAKPYEELTVERLRGVAMAIDSVLEVGKVARQMEIDGKKIERADALAELVPIAEARRSANPLVKDSIKVRFLTLMSALRRVGDWARDMDNGTVGPFSRYMVKPIMDAVGRYKEDRAVRLKELLDIINGRKAELFGKAIMAPEIGHTFANKGELIHAMLHLGNESNMRKLLLGYGWAVENYFQTGDKKGIATNRWNAFMARAQADGTITKEDWDMVQQIWDLLESTKRPAQAAHKRIYGFYFNEVEARPITTPFGVYKGGYAPAIVDKFLTAEGDIRASEQSEQMPATAMFPTTGSGFTKSRVENYAAKLELNLMLLPAHLDKVLRFTHLEPVVRQTGSLLRDRALAEPLKQQNPAILNSMLFPWLQRVAQQAVEQPAQTDAGRQMAKFWRGIRSRVGIATMFANVVNVLQQITGFSTAAVIVKPTYLKSAMFRFVSDGAAMRQTMIDTSPFMKDRATNQSREILNRIEEAVVKPTTMAEMNDWFKRHGYFLQQAFQNFMDPIVWHAAYDQAIANGATASDAAFEADQAIQRSQSDNSPETLSTFETGPAFQRLFTMFYSYFGAQANMLGTEVSTAMRTMGWNGKKRLFWIYVAGLAIPAIVSEMIVRAFNGGLEDDDDDGYADEILSLFLLSQVRYAVASVPVVSQFSNAVIGQFTKEYYDDRVSTSPVIGAVERAIRAPSSVAAAIEDPEKAPRAVSDGLFTLGLILGVPAGQLAKTAGYVTGIATGRSNPETPIDLVQGAVSGRDGTER